MARIPTYQKDIYISDLDRIIGTDGDTNELVTKNFFLGDIAEYVIDKFIDPDAVSFTIPVLRDTQDTLGSNATRITGSIMSQDINPDGTLITIAGKLQVDKEAKIKGKLTEGVAESGQLILNSSLNAAGITIKAPAHADLPASYTMELPNDIGAAGSQLTTDGIGKVYWADPEDDDLTVNGDLGTGTIDLDTQSLNIIGGANVSTTMLDQTLTISAAGFITGSGTPYKLALWDQTENLTDSLISQGSPSAGSLVEINSPQVVIGTNNATPYNQKLIGEGINALNESLITSSTNVVLGEGSYGGVQGRKYYRDNTVVLDRILRLGSAQDTTTGVYNTIPTIHMGDPEWVRSNPFINYAGIQGFFPTYEQNSTLYSNRFMYFSSVNVPSDGTAWGSGVHTDGARYQMMFDAQFGLPSGGTGRGDVFGTSSDANCSAGVVEYRTASQNYDYQNGPQSTPGSQGIFTFDARYNNNNYTAVGGTSLFLLKSGYGSRKFEIKQNSGGTSNPGAALIFGKGASSTSESSVAMGNAVTASGLYSFASGDTTTASGVSSFASGKNTTTTVQGGAVFGKNNSTTDALFTIGKGASTSAKSDLFVGTSNGPTHISFNASKESLEFTPPVNHILFELKSGPTNKFSITQDGGGGVQVGNGYTSPGPSFNMGGNAFANGKNALALGAATTAFGNGALAANFLTLASGGGASAFGLLTEAAGLASVSFGNKSVASGDYSIVAGQDSIASGQSSVAIGEKGDAQGKNTFVSGFGGTATANNAVKFGYEGSASGNNSAKFGFESVASGANSLATGTGTTAGGAQSIATGDNNVVSNNNSFVGGKNSTVTGQSAFAFGQANTVASLTSAAFGQSNTVNGFQSFVAGWNNNTNNFANQILLGIGLDSSQNEAVVLGRYNDNTDNYNKFQIGNGTADAAKSNALSINGAGYIKLPTYGSGNVSGTATRNLSVAADGQIIETPVVAGPDYLSFVCLLSQSGGADPQPDLVLENSLGIPTPFTAFTRVSSGEYNLSATGKFKSLKTIVFLNGGSAENNHDVAWEVIDANNLRIRTHNSDDKLTKAALEIRTYN
jgi:hypothetical protein